MKSYFFLKKLEYWTFLSCSIWPLLTFCLHDHFYTLCLSFHKNVFVRTEIPQPLPKMTQEFHVLTSVNTYPHGWHASLLIASVTTLPYYFTYIYAPCSLSCIAKQFPDTHGLCTVPLSCSNLSGCWKIGSLASCSHLVGCAGGREILFNQ